MGSISKDFKILQEAYSKRIIAEAGGTPTGTANAAKIYAAKQQQAQQPEPLTSAGVAAAISDAGPVASTPAATTAQPAKDQADFDAAVTKYFKTQGVSDADIKKFLDSTHNTLKSFASTNAPASAPATKPWQPGFTSAAAAPAAQPAPAAAPVAPSTARYMPQQGSAAYGAPGFAGRPSYASR